MQRLLVVSTGNARRGRRTGGVWRQRGRDAFGEPLGDLMLGHRRPILDRVAVHEMDRVPVAAKGAGAGRHVIGEDPVAALALALRTSIRDDILGLGGKADNQPRPVVAASGDRREDAWVFDKPQAWRPPAVPFPLLAPRASDPPSGNRPRPDP